VAAFVLFPSHLYLWLISQTISCLFSAINNGLFFRATKEQIMEVQKMLKDKQMYAGEATGKLDDATREGIRKFQTANGVKMTGTLNKETLEKMNITLTDRQKEM
jgi:peptidoglycan hydrolase-like protein with peptidoglycan-binding domain